MQPIRFTEKLRGRRTSVAAFSLAMGTTLLLGNASCGSDDSATADPTGVVGTGGSAGAAGHGGAVVGGNGGHAGNGGAHAGNAGQVGGAGGGTAGHGGAMAGGNGGAGAANGGDAGSGGDAGTGGMSLGAGGDGAGGSVGGSVGQGGSGAGGMPVVHACDSLAAPGTWENINPPVTTLPEAAPCPYGGNIVVNPSDPSMVWAGTCNQGIWKTTDCGATWAHINTGTNGTVLDGGRQWTFVVDPTNPDVLYTNSGYGAASNGAFKSTNGGVDWAQIWPPLDGTYAGIVAYDFVAQVVMDPTSPQHLLISFHAECAAPYNSACYGESSDGGATWKLISGDPSWAGGEGQTLSFLDNGTTWLWGSQANGVWRTTNSGGSWSVVSGIAQQGHATPQTYRAKNGVFYMPEPDGIYRSPDGITWALVPNSGSVMLGITGNGTTMYASRGFPWDPSTNLYEPFWTSPEDDGQTWTQMTSPQLSNGGQLTYDPVHHLLYSANLGAGVWRVVVP